MQTLAHVEQEFNISTDQSDISLHKDSLGAPALYLKDKPGPSLSFSHGQHKLWAAMCSGGRVGIDVAYPEEFDSDYPFSRVFRPEELERAKSLCTDDAARCASLLWSVKESSVKAMGTGFRRLEPVDVRVGAPVRLDPGYLFEVMADRPIAAWARTEGHGWIAVALDRQNLIRH